MKAIDQRKQLQTTLTMWGYYKGPIDGKFEGGSNAAWKALGDAQDAPAEEVKAPAPEITVSGLQRNDWPKEANAAAFFGYPPNLTQVEPPYPMRMFYDGSWHKITTISCNVKVAASLRRILKAILDHYGSLDKLQAAGMDVYDGCYNDRSVRGSSRRSMHAYGAAIDLDAEHNPLGATKWKMPPAVVAIFKAEGWRWGGDYNGRKDAMHFEACS